MTRRQRTLLFSLLLGLFVIVAPSLVLYSQGYRLDFKGGTIAQTGAFYFKVAPPRADILVDGNLTKRTDFLFGSALTKNFFPGKYFVEIQKEGYHPWQKILEVTERTVTEAKNVLLFKKNPAFQKLADNVNRFWVSPNRQYALLSKKPTKDTWELRLLNLETGGSEPFLSSKRFGQTLLNIQWSGDSRRVLIQQTAGEQITSAVYGISANEPCFEAPCDLAHLGSNVAHIQFSPGEKEIIFYTKLLNQSQVLFSSRYRNEDAPNPIANNVVAFTPHGTSLSWLDQQGNVWQQDPILETAAQAFQDSVFIPKKETPYTLTFAGDSILLKEDTTLYLHQRNSEEQWELLAPALEAVMSPDGNKAAIRNQSELWVLFLTEEAGQPRHQAGEMVLLTRFAEPIEQLSWIGSSHLLFRLKDTVRAVEIDNRDRLNAAELAVFPEPKIFWNDKTNALYVLSENTLSASENIVR